MASGICFSFYGWLAVTLGWPFLFYVPAFIGLLWCVLWFIYVKNDPSDDSRITEGELKYIQSTVGQKSEDEVIYPWKSLLASVPMWTIAIAHFCRAWDYTFHSSELPSYFNDVWKMNVKDSGLLISIPYFAILTISLSSAVLSDYVIANTKYSVTWVRKLFYTVGELGAAVCFFLVGYSTSSTMALILITISKCFYSVSFCAIYAGALDIAPRFASVVMGITSTVAAMASIIVPTVTGYVVVNENKEEWLLDYLICGGVLTAGTIIYLLFASGEIQPWARTNAEKNSEV